MNDQQLTAADASALLAKADQAAATASSASSWPAIAMLMTFGASAASSLLAYSFSPRGLIWLPIIVQMVWLGITFLICLPRLTSVKRGFGRRWLAAMVSLGVSWALCMVGSGYLFTGQTWFLVTGCLVLTAIAAVGSYVESRR